MVKKRDDKKIAKETGFQRTLIGTPLAAASVYAGAQTYRDRRFNLFNKQSPVTSAIKSANRNINKNNRFSSQFMNENASFFRSVEGAEIARAAWEKAIHSTSSNPDEIMNFAGDINSMSAENVASSIEQTLARNESLFMNKTFMRFKTNVAALKVQSSFGSIPKFKEFKDLTFGSPTAIDPNTLPAELHASFSRITKSLDAYGQVQFQTRKGWEKQGFGQYIFNFNARGKKINLTVPVAKNGVLVEGMTSSSKRIAPDVMIFDPRSKKITSNMSRHEFFMKNFEETVLPKIISGEYQSNSQIRNAVNELYKENIYALENIPNLPEGINHPGWSDYSKIGGQAVDIKVFEDGKFRNLSERELGSAIEASGLYPSTSPSNIAAGRLSKFNPADWAINSRAVDYSRRPSQARREWKATHKAIGEMLSSGNTKWSIFETQGWRRDMGPYAAPHLRTLYIDPSKHYKLAEKIRMGEGESLIAKTRSIQSQMEVSRIATPIHLKSVREDLMEKIKSGHQFQHGEILGFDTEGLPVSYEKNMKLLDLVENETKGKGQFGSLFYEQVHSMSESEKKFKDIKAMERFTQDAYKIDRAVKDISDNPFFTGNVTRWASMDELKKDQAKHTTQMITSMWDTLDQMRTRDFVARNRRLSSFMRNPRATAELFSRRATTNGIYSHEAFTKQLIEFGMQQGRLTPEEFGNVFGALPVVFGSDKLSSLVPNQTYMNAINSGFAGGISQAVFGGTKELTGAGAKGSFEPRALDLLSGGQYGKLGDNIAKELASRMISDNPEKLASYNALTKTFESISGKVSPLPGNKRFSAQNYSYPSFQKFIEGGGGFLDVGKGQKPIFVPGASDFDSMTPFLTGAGQETPGMISNLYHGIAEEAAMLHSKVDPYDISDYRRSLQGFIKEIGKQTAPAGKGIGSILRGRVEGSRFLTGVSQAGGHSIDDPFTIGVPEQIVQKMFAEMKERGLYSREQLIDMEQRISRGENIGGLAARHPFIGPYSVQPVNIRPLKGVKDPVMVIPSRMVNLQMEGQSSASPINISPMVGMAGDLDADIYSATLVSPDLEKQIRQEFTQADNEYTRAFTEHNIRAQIIKAKSPGASGEGLDAMMRRIAEGKKLGTAQEWTPKLSVSLTNARKAVSANLSGQEAADANFLLQWLEQVPISGKHLKAPDILSDKMSSSFQTIASAIEEHKPARLEGAVRSILGESSDVTRRLLTEDVKILQGANEIRAITGVKSMRDTLPGINLKSTTENIMSALERAGASGAEEAAQMMIGRKAINSENLSKYLNLIAKPSNGGMAAVSEAALAGRNLLGSIGEGIIKHHKAIGLGFIGSIAVASALSSPKDTIGPQSGNTNMRIDRNPGKASKNITPENIHPDSPRVGNPTVPAMMNSPTARILPSGQSNQQVRAMTMNRRSTNNMVNGISQATRGNYSVNIRDDRRSLNPNRIIDKLF